MTDISPTTGDVVAQAGQSGHAGVGGGQEALQDRSALLREINLARQERLREREVFLVVINIADTKKYDDIIRVFGYKFADDLLSIRLADLKFINIRQHAFRVGFWSVGLIFRSQSRADYESALSGLISLLAKPLICRGIPVSIKAGVGLCDLMKGLGSAEDLLQATFLAGQAAAATRRGYVECNYDLAEDHRRAFALIAHAGHSLTTEEEFELSYQPRLDIKSGRCASVEALLRWHHPTLGLVMPGEFIPLIEMTGLVQELTVWVLSRAIAQAAGWYQSGLKLKICVNISPKNLEEPDFVLRLRELLHVHGLPAANLELEFSAARSFSNIEQARRRLTELQTLGVSIAIDDFGIGTDGFAALEYIPADVVKIDRSLAGAIVGNPRQQVLVKALINIAHELGIMAVAEGTETEEALNLLMRWDCDFAEGYLISQPMTASSLVAWYAEKFG
jgi:EAL domain-containing protein (putative c-di-GMP-specific phosphodiesterase class I)